MSTLIFSIINFILIFTVFQFNNMKLLWWILFLLNSIILIVCGIMDKVTIEVYISEIIKLRNVNKEIEKNNAILEKRNKDCIMFLNKVIKESQKEKEDKNENGA